MLLSAGDFAVYMSEMNVFNMLVPRFGDLGVRRNREALLDAWLPSEFFRRTGLDAAELKAKILAHCRNGGDLLRLVMGSVACQQNARRWAECTPDSLLYLSEIKREIPEALFVHIIRDGRDVGLSLAKQGWIRPFAWDRNPSSLAAALFWEWIVGSGRRSAPRVAPDYMEISFEDVVTQPRKVLVKVGAFIEHDLDYDRILQAGIGSVSRPNTSFQRGPGGDFNPVGRWMSGYTAEELARLESLIGASLTGLGYALVTPREKLQPPYALKMLRAAYRLRFSSRHWLKSRTPLGKVFANVELLQDFHTADQDRMAQK
jgi:hypothetical protein